MTPEGYTSQQKKELVVHTENFFVIAGNLYKMGSNEILCHYVPKFERNNILTKAHEGVVRGNYAGKATMQKILRARLWWPTLHKDSKVYCRACDACQRTGRPSSRDELLLNPQISLQTFEKWVIDFAGPIQPPGKKTGAQYIINVTEYLTKWAKTQLMKDCTSAKTKKFIFEYILTRFGFPKILMSNCGTHFLN